MKIAKVNCPIISEALKDRRTFSTLSCYIEGFGGYKRTEDGCFLSEIVQYDNKPTLNLKLSLEDYFFNEEGREAEKLWEFAEKLTGKKNIEWTIIKIVEL